MKKNFCLSTIVTFILGYAAITNAITVQDLAEKISGVQCSQPHSQSCPQIKSSSTLEKLDSLTETSFFNKLAEAEIVNLKCGQDYWNSLAQNSNTANEFLNQVNSILPKAQNLRQKIRDLSKRNAFLRGQIQFNIPADQLSQVPNQLSKRKEYESNQNEIKHLQTLQDSLLAQIPQIDVEPFRNLILDKLNDSSSAKVDLAELKFISNESSNLLKEKSANLTSKKSGYNYDLTSKQKEDLATDQLLVTQIGMQNPTAGNAIQKYSCQAKARKKTSEKVEQALLASSLFLSGGSSALAISSRMAFVAKSNQLGARLASASRTFAYSATLGGGSLTLSEVHDSCGLESPQINTSCKQTTQTIQSSFKLNECLFLAGTSALTAGSPVINKMLNSPSSEVGQFLKTLPQTPQLKQLSLTEKVGYLNSAGKLNDNDRVVAASLLLNDGKSLSKSQKTSLIQAHQIGKDKKYFSYTPDELKQKYQTLLSGGWSPEEANTIIRTGLAGNASSAEDIYLNLKGQIQTLSQKGTPGSGQWRLLGDAASMTNRDAKVEYGQAFSTFLKEKQSANTSESLQRLIPRLKERELMVFEELSAKSGNTEYIATSIKRRYNLIKEDIARTTEPFSRSDVFEDTLRKEINSFKANLKSGNINKKLEAERMIEAFKTAFPTLK